ncbi:carboxymuconolactone decarboxylase family protein [Stratiformator vulcanicus]|uniref:Carboxymuconolactone decarboxylase family protein n=1 Tax=Stratiformator vulcanicus TaxID=2527980 RepID=A0A517R7P5_9PLAN|nr:carboxymuconolactone decarboxylase family protein [Stratiformator vulcanicus]QDT39906.1 Carboxymuconolactone decarboxylase family protein [Stratiformator vulcanicus]
MADFIRHTHDTVSDAGQAAFQKAEQTWGMIPNLIRFQAEAPAVADAYMTMHGIFSKQTSFSPTEQQVVLMTSNFENDCHYCMAAHSMIAEKNGMPEDVLRALREATPIADPKLEALREFSRKVVVNRGWVEEADISDFLDAGWTKQQVLEVILGVSFKVLSNYTNHVVETPVDKPFEGHAWTKPVDAAV